MNPEIRGSGRTHRQMLEAPHGATFVWCNNHPESARHIVANADRRDLKIVPLCWLDDLSWIRGVAHVVFDHDCPRTSRVLEAIELSIAHRKCT